MVIPRSRGPFRYSTKDIVPDMFIQNFDDMKVKFLGARTGKSGGFLAEDHRENLQGIAQESLSPRGSRNPNYWWNEEIARLRGETLKKRRLAQRARLRNEE